MTSNFHDAVDHLQLTHELLTIIVQITCELARFCGRDPTPEEVLAVLLKPGS